ncbi:CHASE3 domain-containing protein [Streptomyces koyangensis]|uniref:histidine kinase n=1 Tax=Streptomyces koyangensis TaxID=188770 RepID=A0A385DKZ1_9ACTN|nr:MULTISPECIES: sensor histidine kinase [Streptomyces]AXQ58451.1 HAMP domain-containing protein [Streptomyces koyangensis]PKR44330.1 histidine kinase [Streptomyces sp. EAG2]
MTQPRKTFQERLSVQGWVRLVLAAMVVVVLGCTAVAGVLLSRTNDRTNELVDRIQPARSIAFQLQKSLLDQETGVRGYVLSGDTSFLTPYEEGREGERDHVARIERYIGGDARFAEDVERIEKAAGEWRREQAEPLIAAVREGGPQAATAVDVTESKLQFDYIRDLFDAQQSHLEEARADTRAELNDARSVRDIALVVVLVVFVLAVVVLALLLHRMVGRPLDSLLVASERVREGDFERRIEMGGPSDLRAVGAAVEAMRRRLVEELVAARTRETLLTGQTDELRRSNAELEQFAYVASHDLQEPLRKVASFCQLLEKRYSAELDDRGRQYIDFAVDGAKRMQVLINDLLTFSRVGRVGDAWQQTSLDAALDRGLGNLELAVEESGATVVRDTPLPEVSGDPTTLAMLWQNLLGNALKFRRPDVPVRIEVDCVREDDDTWHLSVTDNGIGIAPEFSEKVFVIFQRLHAKDAYGGTGIGLALCRKIVEFHGGRIWLEPVTGPGEDGDAGEVRGTRVHFTLPAAVTGSRSDLLTPATTSLPGDGQ